MSNIERQQKSVTGVTSVTEELGDFQNLRESIIDLYLTIKIRSTDDVSNTLSFKPC